jgi:hypothetical protein
MAFIGLRDYRTGDPAQLREDLQRQNLAVEDGFRIANRAHAPRWNPFPAIVGATLRHGDAPFVNAERGTVTFLLPPSTPDTRGLGVRFTRATGTGDIVVASQRGQLVQGAMTDTLSSSIYAREYIDDGRGNWWRQEDGGTSVNTGGGFAAYHDTTHSPIVLYQFDGDLTDASGNALTLTVSTGTECYTDLLPGLRGVNLDGLRLTHAFNAIYQITGDITIEFLGHFFGVPNGEPIVVFSGGTSDASSTLNYLYEVSLSTATNRQIFWFSEHGTGVNDAYGLTAQSMPPPGRTFHFAATRTANVIQFYVDGKTHGPASSALTAPTDGSASIFWVGGIAGTGTASVFSGMAMASLKIIPSALTAAQVLAEYNRTLGPWLGTRT